MTGTDFNYNYDDNIGLTIGLTIGVTVGGLLLLPCIIFVVTLCLIFTICVCNKNCPLYEATHRRQHRRVPVTVISPYTLSNIGMIILL